MKNTLLLLILLPLFSFGQSKKDLKARIYSMQLDSANQANLISDQQSKIVKTEAEIQELTIQIIKLNSDLSEARVEADAIQEQLKLTKDSEIELKGEVSILQMNLQITQDSLEFLSNVLNQHPNNWDNIKIYLEQQNPYSFCESEEGKEWLSKNFQNRVFRALSGIDSEDYEYYSDSIKIKGDWMYRDNKRCPSRLEYSCDRYYIELMCDRCDNGCDHDQLIYSVIGDYLFNRYTDRKYFPSELHNHRRWHID